VSTSTYYEDSSSKQLQANNNTVVREYYYYRQLAGTLLAHSSVAKRREFGALLSYSWQGEEKSGNLPFTREKEYHRFHYYN
jgi:hypothetical protein